MRTHRHREEPVDGRPVRVQEFLERRARAHARPLGRRPARSRRRPGRVVRDSRTLADPLLALALLGLDHPPHPHLVPDRTTSSSRIVVSAHRGNNAAGAGDVKGRSRSSVAALVRPIAHQARDRRLVGLAQLVDRRLEQPVEHRSGAAGLADARQRARRARAASSANSVLLRGRDAHDRARRRLAEQRHVGRQVRTHRHGESRGRPRSPTRRARPPGRRRRSRARSRAGRSAGRDQQLDAGRPRARDRAPAARPSITPSTASANSDPPSSANVSPSSVDREARAREPAGHPQPVVLQQAEHPDHRRGPDRRVRRTRCRS